MSLSRLKLFWAFLLAIVLGYSVYAYMNSLQHRVPVVVAETNIPARSKITTSMVGITWINSSDVLRLAPQAFSSVQKVVGAVAVQSIPKGEVLHDNPHWVALPQPGMLTNNGATRLSYFLPANGLAETVTEDDQGAIGGQLHRGDLVDAIFTSQHNSTGGVYSAMILQDVPVLEVQRPSTKTLASQPGNKFQVTLLLTPSQALALAMAKRQGYVDLALASQHPKAATLPPLSPLAFTKAPSQQTTSPASRSAAK